MPNDLIVVNASPLIFLGNAGRLELLRALGAGRIIVPESVVSWEIGEAEASVVATALLEPGTRVVIDDLNGRKCAHGGVTLQTMRSLAARFRNAINVPAWQDQVILRPGQPYRHVMVHAFHVEP